MTVDVLLLFDTKCPTVSGSAEPSAAVPQVQLPCSALMPTALLSLAFYPIAFKFQLSERYKLATCF